MRALFQLVLIHHGAFLAGRELHLAVARVLEHVVRQHATSSSLQRGGWPSWAASSSASGSARVRAALASRSGGHVVSVCMVYLTSRPLCVRGATRALQVLSEGHRLVCAEAE
jgi:hypothetical protein